MSVPTASGEMATTVGESGIKRRTFAGPSQVRHLYVTLVSFRIKADLLGHADLKTTSVYAQLGLNESSSRYLKR